MNAIAYKTGREKVLVNTGLSSSVAGCTVELVRDASTMVAAVVVRGDPPETGVAQSAVEQTAKLLVSRAKRFLGLRWTVIPWDGSYE